MQQSRGRGRYRENLDHKVFAKAWQGKNDVLMVSVYSYKGGKPKLQLTRERVRPGQPNIPYVRLGRLSKEEVLGLLPILQEALSHLR